MSQFSRKNMLITGGTKGLGLATAKMFAGLGTHVYVTYRKDEESAKSAIRELESLGVECAAIQCDLSEDGAVDALFDELKKHTDTLDIYVHNAAATAFKPLSEIKAHHIDKTFNITVKSFVLAVQQVSAMMKNGGSIVSVSGLDTYKVIPRHGLLGAAKASLEQLSTYWAHELAPQNIRVNCVNPGFMETDSVKIYLGDQYDAVRGACEAQSPLGRMPKLEEVASVIKFLCSNDATWTVGQVINVDGGADKTSAAIPRS